MNTDKVSVIVPIYNAAAFLPACLDSLLGQTYHSLEVLVTDDGSEDNGPALVRQYAAQDSRVKLLTKKHVGLGDTWQYGLDRATGEYVCFIDADDVLHPQALEMAVRAAEEHRADFVAWPYFSFTGQAAFEKVDLSAVPKHIYDNPVFIGAEKIHYVVWGKLCRRTLLKDIHFWPQGEFIDIAFVYEVLSRKPKTVLLDSALYGYRNNPASFSNKVIRPQSIAECHGALLRIAKIYDTPDLNREKDFLVRDFIPRILKNQLYRCRHAAKESRPEMFAQLGRELKDLRRLGWFKLGGNRVHRYLFYWYLMGRASLKEKTK